MPTTTFNQELNKRKCLLIIGGQSDEHRASVHTAVSISRILSKSSVIELGIMYISEDGDFFIVPTTDLDCIENTYNCDLSILKKFECNFILGKGSIEIISEDTTQTFDVVFPIVLGKTGESGEIYGLLQLLNIPFIGPSMNTSAELFDKEYSKLVYENFGIPHLPYIVERAYTMEQSSIEDLVQRITGKFGFPCAIKPARQGSSLGFGVCRGSDDIANVMERALQYDNKVIIEPYIRMTEHLCYVWRDHYDLKSSQIMSIHPRGGIYDFDQKYIDKTSVSFKYYEHDCSHLDTIRYISENIYRSLQGLGVWRFDYFVDDRDSSIMINEINTVPAFINAYRGDHLLDRYGNNLISILEEQILTAHRNRTSRSA